MDAFAELEVPRSAFLDEALVAAQFDALSHQRHPDAKGGQGDTAAFAQLTQARQILTNATSRLRHLLELEYPGTPLHGAMSPGLMDLFSQLSPVLQETTQLLQKAQSASSSLAKALLTPHLLRTQERLEACGLQVNASLHSVLSDMGPGVPSQSALAQGAREAAFLEKWQLQVRENLVRIQMALL